MFQAKLMVWITVFVFVIYGALFVVSPGVMFERVTGSELLSRSALIDVRATYGGLSVAVGLVLARLALNADTLRTAVMASMWLAALMGLTRAMGFLVDQNPSDTMVFYLGAEVVFTLWGGLILRKLRTRRYYFK
ncbi:DUF4345 family protein [Vibrio sp. 10N.261.51.F12]|uniref:DUF4345 family protein n=1 Tax=Vibrio sp. 10N.261.51.F12 TaxID=3229679 RepID=UPI00354C8E00